MEPINLLNNNMMQMSMYENLKTGNIIIDMLLSTIAVSLFTTIGIFIKDNMSIFDYTRNISNKLCCYKRKNNILLEGFYVVRAWNGHVKTDFPIVIDALFWYIGKQQYENDINVIKLHNPNLKSFIGEQSNNDEDIGMKSDDQTKIDTLKKNLIFRPQNRTHFSIDDINIQVYEKKIEGENNMRENLLYNLQIYLKDNSNSTKKIKGWLETIQYQYEQFQKNQLEKQKKVFTMIKQDDQIEWYEEQFISGKIWNNLFCTNKNLIKNKLDFFVKNREWYKKRGIPWTFGVLTYGPPGCGKTSLEKVFLNYLDRHGVQLNIDESTTYKDIREIFYNPYINGKFIPLDKRIYIIPDIDAMGKVLLKRSESGYISENTTHDNETSNKHFIDENSNIDNLELENTVLKNEKKILEDKIKTMKTSDEPSLHLEKKNLLHSSNNVMTPGSKSTLMETKFLDLMKGKNQGISLSQILNLLDGIVELDGRVLIACTNHIHKLDPALIRPGRIDCVVELGLCTHQMMKDIIENFYEVEIPFENIKKIKENYYSPCKIYEICFRNTVNMDKALTILQNNYEE